MGQISHKSAESTDYEIALRREEIPGGWVRRALLVELECLKENKRMIGNIVGIPDEARKECEKQRKLFMYSVSSIVVDEVRCEDCISRNYR